MTLENRVTPDGRFVAAAARGTMMGNRGVLHDQYQTLGRARWRHKNWVACRLEFKGRRRRVMTPGRYTELFFLDEAVALAAGHRPCAECRNADYKRFKALWMSCGTSCTGWGPISAADLDRVLHMERAVPRRFEQRRHAAELANLPDGAFVLLADDPGRPYLVLGDRLVAYAPEGYCGSRVRPKRADVLMLTPPTTMAVMRAGFSAALHASAAKFR